MDTISLAHYPYHYNHHNSMFQSGTKNKTHLFLLAQKDKIKGIQYTKATKFGAVHAPGRNKQFTYPQHN
jgi:hypothetical protein